MYFCKVISGDDLEGKNEGQVELLVLGESFRSQCSLELPIHSYNTKQKHYNADYSTEIVDI